MGTRHLYRIFTGPSFAVYMGTPKLLLLQYAGMKWKNLVYSILQKYVQNYQKRSRIDSVCLLLTFITSKGRDPTDAQR